MSDLIFELKDVSFSYLGRFLALKDINLNIRKGEKVVIVGANGCGKSTLLHMLDGLIFPERGVVKFLGRQLQQGDFNDDNFSRDFRRKVGLLFQNSEAQLFCPTVEEDIVFGPLQLGLDKELIRQRYLKLVRLLGIEGISQRPIHRLSIGEKRRAALAAVLIIEPEVILLDEPTSGLDPSTSRVVVDIILQANAEGKTVVTATHDMHIIEEIADRVLCLGQEKTLVKEGPVAEIMRDRKFLQDNNLIHAHRHTHGSTVHLHPHSHLEHHS